MSHLRIGTSGYSYLHWRAGVVYPSGLPARLWLPWYAAHFDSVELNATFYRLPPPGAADHWAAAVGPRFRFAVKGSRYLTHLKRLTDPQPGIDRFFKGIEGLGRKRGPVLWQLPANFRRDTGRLADFLAALPAGRHAFEFRDDSWICDEVFDVLAEHDAALVLHDLLEVKWPWPPPGPFVYWRFHGATSVYGGRYGPEKLRPVARRLLGLKREAWVFFNNDVGGHAFHDARTLKALCGQPTPLRAPPLPEHRSGGEALGSEIVGDGSAGLEPSVAANGAHAPEWPRAPNAD